MIQEFYYGTSWHWPLPYLPRMMLSYNFIRTLKKAWKKRHHDAIMNMSDEDFLIAAGIREVPDNADLR